MEAEDIAMIKFEKSACNISNISQRSNYFYEKITSKYSFKLQKFTFNVFGKLIHQHFNYSLSFSSSDIIPKSVYQ